MLQIARQSGRRRRHWGGLVGRRPDRVAGSSRLESESLLAPRKKPHNVLALPHKLKKALMNKEAPHTRSSMNYSILRISSTSPDAPTAPRFLIPSLVFLLGGGAPRDLLLLGGGAHRDLLLLGGGAPRGVSSSGPRFSSVLARHSPWRRQTRTAQGEESVEHSGLGNGNGYSECCTGTTVHTLELHRRR